MTPHEAETTYEPVPFDPGDEGGPRTTWKKKTPKRKHNRESKTQPPSKSDLCLLAIARLEAVWKRGGVPKAAIVVEAWKANPPATFGLAGYEDTYPSDNRVIMELVKMKNQRVVRQPKESYYALTDMGRAIVARLGGEA